jgi:hypothetical protein
MSEAMKNVFARSARLLSATPPQSSVKKPFIFLTVKKMKGFFASQNDAQAGNSLALPANDYSPELRI